MEIRHIPRKRNPADSLRRQIISDALLRKDSVKDANSEYVQRIRVSENATDEDIQTALHELFNQDPPGYSVSKIIPQDNQGPHDQTVLSESSP